MILGKEPKKTFWDLLKTVNINIKTINEFKWKIKLKINFLKIFLEN